MKQPMQGLWNEPSLSLPWLLHQSCVTASVTVLANAGRRPEFWEARPCDGPSGLPRHSHHSLPRSPVHLSREAKLDDLREQRNKYETVTLNDGVGLLTLRRP